MFCSKCGKPTENNQPICNDCLQAMNGVQPQPQQAYQPYQAYQQPYQQSQQAYYQPPKPSVPSLNQPTLGKAITSMILSSVALVVMYILFFNALDAASYYYYYYYWDSTMSIVWNMLFLPPAIIGTVFGAKSLGGSQLILTDGTVKKHIPTFVLGLVGMIQGIIALICSFATFCIAIGYV